VALTASPANQATYASSANGTSHTLTFGFTPVKGSTLILMVRAGDAATVSTPPAGWTVSNTGAFAGRMTAFGYWKMSDGTETAATVVFGASTTCTLWVGNWPDRLVFNSTTSANRSATTFPTMNNITTTAAPTLLIGTWTNGTTATSAYTAGTVTDSHTELAFPSTSGGTTLNGAISAKVTNTAAANNGVGITAAASSDHHTQFFSFPTWVPTPKFICGAECGIAAVGTLSAGTEHWSAASGAPTVVTTHLFPSTRAFRFASGVGSTLTHTFATAIASPGTEVTRFKFYFAVLPTSDAQICNVLNSTEGVFFDSTTGKIAMGSTGFVTFRGPTINANQVYEVCFLQTRDNGPNLRRLTVDGVEYGNAGSAGVASGGTGITIGNISGRVCDLYMDDIITSAVGGDYPIPSGIVAGLYPNGDKPNASANPSNDSIGHFFSATTDFGKGTGGATATGAQNVESTTWQSLNKPIPVTTPTTWVANLLGSVSEYLVWTLEDLPAGAQAINGVMAVASTHSAAATANEFGLLQVQDTIGQVGATFGVIDLSEITPTIPVVIVATAPNSVPWSVANVNSSLLRWGNSSDVNPDPYLDGACLEVDYVPTPPATAPPLKVDPYRQLLNH